MTDSKKILIVDDHPTNRLKLNMVVKKLGHEVVMASGGADALEKLNANPSFDLVLLDILMPEIDGHQVLQTMQQDKKLVSIPVVVVSSVKSDIEVARCIDEGAKGSLDKDFESAQLKSCITRFAR